MGSASVMVKFRAALLTLMLGCYQAVLSDLTFKPLDAESLVNEATFFNCSSSNTAKKIHWYHYPVGVEAHQRKYLYDSELLFFKDYEEDFVLEKNSSYGAYNLVIRSVKPSYAGRYECQDNEGLGNSAFAQLIVLDGEPRCSSDINPDGVIGPNDCGIQPDELHLSCSISYHGNIVPVLTWNALGDNDSIGVNATKEQLNGRFTYNVTITSDQIKDKSSFECQTTKSRTSKHSCISETVKLLYVFGSSSVSVRNLGEVVNCSANTNIPSCQYKWKWYNAEDSLTVSHNRILNINKTGQHRCEATCGIGGISCTVDATFINATFTSSINDSGDSAATSHLVIIFVFLLCVLVVGLIFIFIICWRKRRHQDIDWHPELLYVESLKSADNEKTIISGLAVLDKELFVVLEKDSLVKVYQAIPFIPLRSFSILDLDSPLDMVSSPTDNALYISTPNRIFKVDAIGNIIVKWPIDDGGGTLSVTYDKTVLLSDRKRCALMEYLSNGELMCEVSLPSDVHPFHAVKTSVGQFVVGYEQGMVHKVAKFHVNGTIIQSFSGMLKIPKYLVVHSHGYIFVADRNNSRVLMMNPTLKTSKVLVTAENKLYRPSRIFLDEEDGLLFVADVKEGDPWLIVFRLTKHEKGNFCGLFRTLHAEERDMEGSTPLIGVPAVYASQSLENNRNTEEDKKVTDDTNPVGEYSIEEAYPLLEIPGTTAENPINISGDEQNNASHMEVHPDIDWHPEFLHVEILKSANNEKTIISGLTVLDKELFVVFENNSLVKVFQAISFNPLRSFSIVDLDNPLDMISSAIAHSLYISSPKEIFKVDTSGKVIVKWLIDDGGGTLSMTHGQSVLLSDRKRCALREYSSDGELMCEVRLPSDVHPFHAVKTSFGQFVVGYEQGMVHMVAIFDKNGTIFQSYSGKLKFLKYLVVHSDGCIFVADRNNSRVLMMNPTLESSKELLTEENKLYRPSRICLDEENSRMFVADIKAGDPGFIVFGLTKRKTDSSEVNVVNQDAAHQSTHDLKEDGIEDVTSGNIAGKEEEVDQFFDTEDTFEEGPGVVEESSTGISDTVGSEKEEETLEESRGKKRKR